MKAIARLRMIPGVELDLEQIGVMHPLLQRVGEAAKYQRSGALALSRSSHAPGVLARVENGGDVGQATIQWKAPPDVALALELADEKRVTEDGAEAVALAFVHARSGWTVSRRIQQGGSGDWLLTNPSKRKMTLALEVSGTVADDVRKRLPVKLAQVAKVTEKRCVRAAVVVGFVGPEVLAATVEGEAVP